MEVTNAAQSLIKKLNFSASYTGVLGEELERFGVVIQALDVSHVLENGKERLGLGSGGEENGCVSSFNSVLGKWRLMVFG